MPHPPPAAGMQQLWRQRAVRVRLHRKAAGCSLSCSAGLCQHQSRQLDVWRPLPRACTLCICFPCVPHDHGRAGKCIDMWRVADLLCSHMVMAQQTCAGPRVHSGGILAAEHSPSAGPCRQERTLHPLRSGRRICRRRSPAPEQRLCVLLCPRTGISCSTGQTGV